MSAGDWAKGRYRKLRGRFRKHRETRQNNATNATAVGAQPDGNAAMAWRMAAAGRMAATENQGNENEEQTENLPSHLEELAIALRNSRRDVKNGAEGNSAQLDSIVYSLQTMGGLLDMSLTGDAERRRTIMQLVYQGYQSLIETCESYIATEEKKFTSKKNKKGLAILGIVGQTKKLAELDVNNLVQKRILSGDVQAETVRDAISKARIRTIEMETSDAEHKHVGGAASNLTVLTKEENGGKVGYFGSKKIIHRDLNQDKEYLVQSAIVKSGVVFDEAELQLIEECILKPDLTVDILNNFEPDSAVSTGYSELRKYNADRIKEIDTLPAPEQQVRRSKYESMEKFLDALSGVAKGFANARFYAFSGGLMNVKADEADMGARNVASSRVAELLGVGHLIAKSETVELREKGKDFGRYGNLMEEAPGKQVLERIVTEIGAKYLEKEHFTEDIDAAYLGEEAKKKITGSFQRDMADLQVLDYLCGQIDRHHENYFIQADKDGNYTGVKGIDNDISFGDTKVSENAVGYHGRRVISEDGELWIPHMSKALALKINALNEQMLRFALIDLIAKPELDALCERLRELKGAIQKELAKNPEEGKKSRLLTDGEWGKDTLDDFMNTEAKNFYGAKGSSNYVGNFVQSHVKQAGVKEIERLRERKAKNV